MYIYIQRKRERECKVSSLVLLTATYICIYALISVSSIQSDTFYTSFFLFPSLNDQLGLQFRIISKCLSRLTNCQ